MLADITYGVRTLRRSPGFTSFAVLALAIGIGASATIFSVVNQALLRPLPYRDSSRLVLLQSINSKQQTLEGYSSWDDFQDLRRASNTVTAVSAVSPRWSFTLQITGQAEQVFGQWVSASLFPLLGVHPLLGRAFTEAEDQPGALQGAVLSYELWQRRFGGDAAIIGRRIRIDNSIVPVTGIMPPGFRFLDDAELWVPLAPNSINERGRAVRYLAMAARLKPGFTPQQASAELAGIMRDFERKYPNSNTGFSCKLSRLRDFLNAGTRSTLWLLAGAVALVLLIACGNVANLMLARTVSRRHELAIRMALGARTGRLIRQFISEGLLISSAGGALGLLLASWGIALVQSLKWARIAGLREVRLDGWVLGFSVAMAALTGLLVGLPIAWRYSRANFEMDLRTEGRGTTADSGAQRLRSAVVIAEIALTTVLLAGSGLLLRSLLRLLDVNPGFDARNVLTFQVSLPGDQYAKPEQRQQFYDRLAEAITALPEVRAAGAVSRLPLGEGNITSALTIEGRAIPEGDLPSIDYRIASASYFEAMQIPLIEGRLADPRNPDEVNVNQTAARRFWPGQSPIGKRVKFGSGASQQTWKTVAGVVGDVHHLGLELAPRPEFYRPYVANPLGGPVFAVRANRGMDSLDAAIRERLRAIDPQVPMFNVASMEQLLARSLQPRRFAALLVSLFAGVALLLAVIGLYGLVSFVAGLRTQEMGIRAALGADRGMLTRMMLRQGLGLAAAGLMIGAAVSLAIGPLFASLVYGIDSRDPVALAAALSVLLTAALVACYIPARRASRVDAVIALRS